MKNRVRAKTSFKFQIAAISLIVTLISLSTLEKNMDKKKRLINDPRVQPCEPSTSSAGQSTNHEEVGIYRLCDDLLEIIFGLLPLKDKFRFEGVSKLFKCLMFNKVYKLDLGEVFKGDIDPEILENILKKCPHVNTIILPTGATAHNQHNSVAIILKYVTRLKHLQGDIQLMPSDIKDLSNKYRYSLETLSFDYAVTPSVRVLKHFKKIKNLNVCHGDLNMLFSGGKLKAKNLRSLSFYPSDEDHDKYEAFLESSGATLMKLELFLDRLALNPSRSRFVSGFHKLTDLTLHLEGVLDPGFIPALSVTLNARCRVTRLEICFSNYPEPIDIQNLFGLVGAHDHINFFKLHLGGIDDDWDEDQAVFEGGFLNNCSNLTHLVIVVGHFGMAPDFFDGIGTHCPALSYLIVDGGNLDFTYHSFRELAECKKLRYVDINLDSNRMYDIDTKEIRRLLSKGVPRIETIKLRTLTPIDIEVKKMEEMVDAIEYTAREVESSEGSSDDESN